MVTINHTKKDSGNNDNNVRVQDRTVSRSTSIGSSSQEHPHDDPIPLYSSQDEKTGGDNEDNDNNNGDDFVPVKSRRGLMSRLVLIKERRDARNYPPAIKWFIVFVIALCAMVAPMGSSIFLPAMNSVAEDLNTTSDVVNVSFGIYMIALGVFPLWWSSFSEYKGRRTVYIISFTLFVGMTIGCALSPSIGALMVFRILSGGSAASVQAVGAGTISDIFGTVERGRAMGIFYIGPLCGPLIAPILGGLIDSKWGWRGTQWFLVFVGAAAVILVTTGLPETLRSDEMTAKDIAEQKQLSSSSSSSSNQEQGEVEPEPEYEEPYDAIMPTLSHISSRRSQQQYQRNSRDIEAQQPARKIYDKKATNETTTTATEKEQEQPSSTLHTVAAIFLQPFKSLKFLTFPPVPLSIVFNAYCFCCLYFLNIAIETLYTKSPYDFNSIIVGLTYIPNSFGYLISSVVNGYWSDSVMKRSIEKHGKVVPEDRIAENVYVASALYPCSLLVFGWTAHAKTFWLFPLIGTFLYGLASMLIFSNTMTYLVDTLPGKGSSGVALNNLLRMVLAGIATFVAGPLQRAMGFGWLYTMLAIGSVLAFLSIIAIKKWGGSWRENWDLSKIY